jgi:Holliday junction resolvase RusA-like endonuclease
MEIETVIYMEPVGKARARTVKLKKGDKTVSFTPDPTAHAENLIRDHLMKLKQKFEAGIPLRVVLIFHVARPRSIKKREFPTTKPDLDNCIKLCLDAMNRYVFADDNQVTMLVAFKRYCLPGQVPRIELRITEEKL